jgi:hypothetical protein
MGQSSDDSDEMSFFDINESLDSENFFDIDLAQDSEPKEESKYSITGAFRQEFTYGIKSPDDVFSRKKQGIENINSEILLQVQGRPTYNSKIKISGVADYDWGSWKNNAYSLGESEINLELKDFFIDLTSDSGLWVRLGNQIVARGEIESVKITDIVNPIDISAPGQVEFKDIRTQVPALFISSPIGHIVGEIIFTNNAGSDKLGTSKPGSAFDYSILNNQIIELVPDGIGLLSVDQEPTKSWEIISRLNYKLNGGDISFSVGEINWNQNSLQAVKESIPLILEYGFDRVKVIGISGNLVRSNYLFKYEAALNDGRKFQNTDPLTPWSERQEVVTGIGLEYSGLSNTSLSFELNSSNILDYSTELFGDENATGFVLQARWSGLNDLLSVYGAFNQLAGDESTISTLFIEYDITDSLQLDGRLIMYDARSDSDLFYTFKDQDVIKGSLKYSF